MSRIRPFLGLLVLFELAAPVAAGTTALASITEKRLVHHVETLAADEFQGRRAGTEGAELAAGYLIQQFKSLKLAPKGTKQYRQPFARDGKKLANVVARLEGTDPKLRDEYVILGAHFDHLGTRKEAIFPGADDNASGCAALLEVARALAQEPPKRSVLFIGFDGEEIGLLGSRHFIDQPTVAKRSIVAMINLDMIGRGETADVRVCGTPHSLELKGVVEAAAPLAKLTLHYDKEQEWRRASDHGPFGDAGVPFLYFGVLDHPDYHRPSDTADKINVEKLLRITRLVFLTVHGVAELETPPRFSK